MVEGIVKKIMTTGINKYANLYNVPAEKVQIKVTNNPDANVNYEMCNNFKAVDKVTFLNIMDKKMDIFGYETLASPFLKKALVNFANDNNVEIELASCFIMKHKDSVALAFYNGYKNVKNLTLSAQLADLGL